ncbi:1,4-dihydroxy-2-naphthoate octaprenyltransferase [Planctomycetaceae bacterium]|nr:1,4-dihydroxy-2-naphthoate octaprenyltransferase [Planctomycetaceae bacterium]
MLRKVWAFVRLTRPLFLFGGIVLNLLGLAIATAHGHALDAGRAVLGQVLITSIQLLAHYSNESFDFEVDQLIGERRTWFSGGSGVLAAGELDRAVARQAMIVCAVVAVSALGLAAVQTPIVLLIGTISLAGAYFYSAPPLSLMGSGWGELSTALLTGLFVPVTGYALQAGYIDLSLLLLCSPLVLVYMAMIIAFQFPDREADAAVGKRTLTVRLGLGRAAQLHNLLIVLSLIALALSSPRWAWLSVPLAMWQMIAVAQLTRSGGRHFQWLTTGAVALSGLLPLLRLIDLIT